MSQTLNKNQIKVIKDLARERVEIQDLVAVLCNLKPIIRISGNERIKNLLCRLDLHYVDYNQIWAEKDAILIGKDFSLLKQASEICKTESKIPQETMGAILGYPNCCTDFFCSNFSNIKTIPILTKKNTQDIMDFKLNFLYNFDSRIDGEYQSNGQSTFACSIDDNFIIPHVPCSFNCKPSLVYATKLYNILKKNFPTHLEILEFYLKRPILWISNFEFIVFNGKVKRNRINYTNIIDVNNCTDKVLLYKFKKGNVANVFEDSIHILNNEQVIDEVKIKAHLFNFV